MKSFTIAGQRVRLLKIFAAIITVFTIVFFSVFNLNFICANANASEENVSNDFLVEDENVIDLNRGVSDTAPCTVRFRLSNGGQFSYIDNLEQTPVEKTTNVLEATFETADSVAYNVETKNNSLIRLLGLIRNSDVVIADHDYSINISEAYGAITFNQYVLDERNYDVIAYVGEKYNVNLHTDIGYFNNNGQDKQISVTEGDIFGYSQPYCDGYNFLGFTYSGNMGAYITRVSVVPAKGVWPSTLNAVWEAIPNDYDITFELEDSSAEFICQYSYWDETEKEESYCKKCKKFDFKDILIDGAIIDRIFINYYSVTYSVSYRGTYANGISFSAGVIIYIAPNDGKISDYILWNDRPIYNQFTFDNEGEYTKQNFVVKVKDTQEYVINISSTNRVIFNYLYEEARDGEIISEPVSCSTSSIDVTVPKGYYAYYSFGNSIYPSSQVNNNAYSNNVFGKDYLGAGLVLCVAHFVYDEEADVVNFYREDYAISDVFYTHSIDRKNEIKSAFYGEEQLDFIWSSKNCDDPDKDFTLVMEDNNPAIYNATFNANGGSFADGSSAKELEQKVTTTYNLPEAPNREGYTFNGWYSSENEGDLYTTDTYVWDPEDACESNTNTFYAHWTADESKSAQTGDSNGIVISILSLTVILSAVVCGFRSKRKE